jgi:hypothetical protein
VKAACSGKCLRTNAQNKRAAGVKPSQQKKKKKKLRILADKHIQVAYIDTTHKHGW